MSKLPNTWIVVEIGEIADVVGGGTPKANDEANFTAPGEGIAWLTPADLSGYKSKLITAGARDLTLQGYQSCSAKLMPKGTLLFSSRAPIGYVAVAAKEIATNQGFKSFVFYEGIDPSYAFYYLKSIRKLADSLGTGTTFKELSGATAKTLPFQLAPTAEQTRIAANLDELLAQVDALKVRIDGIPALLKRFRQSVLAAAVSGRLTEEWRAENKGSDISQQINSILSDRLLSSKSKKALASHLSSEEYEIPKNWRWVSLDLLAAKIVDGTHHTPTYVEIGIPFISVKDIRDEAINFTNTKYISAEEHAELCKRCHPQMGDLLITKSGTIGRTAIINTDKEFSLFVSVALIKPASPLVNMQFIDIALRKWVGEIDISSRIVGSAIKNLHLTDMKVLAVPFAPLEEQTEIVRRVDQLFAFADQLEARIEAAQKRIDHLTQSILAKAFRGELVPQDTNDEPASLLLERIKAQRATMPKAKRGRQVAKLS